MRELKITIIGAGAIGGTAGAYLTRAGYDVTLVDSVNEHVQAMNERGLRVSGCRGDHTFRVKAVTPEQVKPPLEMVILSVKAHFTESALRPFVPMLGKDSFVVSMQNGLNEEYIAGMIGPERTVGCFIQFGADYIEPGHVLLAYDFPIWVGEIDGKMTDRAKMVGDILGHVMPATVTDNIWGYLWAKMCLGSIYFAGAVTAEKFADLLARDEFRQVFAAVVRETCTVARSVGVRVEEFPGFDPNLFMVSSASELGPAYAQWDPRPGAVGAGEMGSLKPYTGIQRDIIVRKRRTEVDKQPGDVVRKGREAAVPTPLNSKIVEMIHEIEDGRRQLSIDNLYELVKCVPAWR